MCFLPLWQINNLHTINYTYLNVQISVSTYVYTHETIAIIWIINICHPKVLFMLFCNTSLILTPTNTDLSSATVDVQFLECYTAWAFLCLTSFTQHNYFNFFLCLLICSFVLLGALLFYVYIIICSSICGWTFGLFPILSYYK